MTHGTRYAYTFHGCRCADCRAAAAAARRRTRDRTSEYHYAYRQRNLDKIRAYNRDWMRRYRAELRKAIAA